MHKEKNLIIYGRNSIEEAIYSNISLKQVWIIRGKENKYPGLIQKIRHNNIKINPISEKEIEKISRTQKHQGIAAEIILPENIIEEEENFKDLDRLHSVLILDGITDTGNLGAIVRSALLFNIDAVILPKDNSARITPQVIKASAGAIYKQRVIYVNNINTFITLLKEDDFTIYGLSATAEEDIDKIRFNKKICLVVGSEREGLRKSVKKQCSVMIKIPTSRKIDSLNVSVASAIAMWEVFKNFS